MKPNEEITGTFNRRLISLTRRFLDPARVRARRDTQIRPIAYRLWEEAGQPDGRAEEFWLAGEREFVERENRFWGRLKEPALPNYPSSEERQQ